MALDLLSGLTPEIMAALQEEYLAEPPSGFDTILEEDEEEEDEEEPSSSEAPPQGVSNSSPSRDDSKGQVRILGDSSPTSLEFGTQLKPPTSPTSVRIRKEDSDVIHVSTKLQDMTCNSSSMRAAISSQ